MRGARGVNRTRLAAVLLAAALAVEALVVFWPVVRNGFFVFDDDLYVSRNPRVLAGLTTRGIIWAFTSAGYASNWHPLTWVSHMIDVSLFGTAPGSQHLVNLLLHAAAAGLLLLALRGMTGALWTAGFTAALFAVHPLRVESVAWISERKDVLSGLCFTLTLLSYLRYLRKPSAGRLWAVAAVFALALLAKPMVVTTPLILLLLDWWPLGRLGGGGAPPGSLRRVAAEKIPLLLLSAMSGAMTFIAQNRSGVLTSLGRFPLGMRVSNALVSGVVYLRKMVLPTDLAVFYPHPEEGLRAWQVLGALALLAGISAVAAATARRLPCLAVGWSWYLVSLVPVIGLVQVGGQAMADRYTYLPSIGPALALGWGAGAALRRWPGSRAVAATAAAMLLAALAVATRLQVGYWTDDALLFQRALAVTRGNWVAEYNLGAILASRGRVDEAERHYRQALGMKQTSAAAHNNLANILLARGRIDEALAHYREAVRLNPVDAMPRFNLAVALEKVGRLGEAEAFYREALRKDAEFPGARENLALLLNRLGRPQEALGVLRGGAAGEGREETP